MLTAEKILNKLNSYNASRGIKFKIISDEESFVKSYVKLSKIEYKRRNMNYVGRMKYDIDSVNKYMNEFVSKIETTFS
jgi:hypothetical protein